MSDVLPACPACSEAYTYEDRGLLVCPMCGHEWSPDAADSVEESSMDAVITDAVGNPLADGDTVTVAKDLKVKGAGGGRMQLKSSVVKKVL